MLPGITRVEVCAHEDHEDFGLCAHALVRTRGLGNLGKVDSCAAGLDRIFAQPSRIVTGNRSDVPGVPPFGRRTHPIVRDGLETQPAVT